MSRFSLILIAILVVIVAALFVFASLDTEVAPVRVEKAMLNEAQPK